MEYMPGVHTHTHCKVRAFISLMKDYQTNLNFRSFIFCLSGSVSGIFFLHLQFGSAHQDHHHF